MVPILVEKFLRNQVENAATLEHLCLHEEDEFISKNEENDDLESDKNDEYCLRHGCVTICEFVLRGRYDLAKFVNYFVQVQFLSRNEC